MINAFTVDLEDWYCTRVFEGVLPRSGWNTLPSRVRYGTEIILDLLGRHGITGTFFVLGHIADRDPELIHRIVDAGHEVATHGYAHRHLEEVTVEEFERDLDRSIDVVNRISGTRVCGYRAPTFSITRETASWALPVLRSHGIEFDASIVPGGRHPEYGIRDAPLGIFRTGSGLTEVPISMATIGGIRVPATGGGYFRHLPYVATAWLMRQCNRQGRPVIFYIHPWELDDGQPQIPLPSLRRFRHYHGIAGMRRKLTRLLQEFSFTSIRGLLATMPSIPAVEF